MAAIGTWEEALKAIATEAHRVAECSKRDVGDRAYHKTLEGKQYRPEVIEAFILNKLRADARQPPGAAAATAGVAGGSGPANAHRGGGGRRPG